MRSLIWGDWRNTFRQTRPPPHTNLRIQTPLRRHPKPIGCLVRSGFGELGVRRLSTKPAMRKR